jgi:beta-galactosidase
MAVPEEQHWRDVKLIADCGGRMLRPGHVPCSPSTVAACDAYGVCLFENTTDDEWKIKGDTAVPYKKEFHRDCIIRDRNNPSVVVWELDNGPGQIGGTYVPGINKPLIDTIKKWDFITPRTASTRDGEVLASYTPSELIVGYCNEFKTLADRPTWNAEAWMFSSVRYWWNTEVQHANSMIFEFRKTRDNNGCAWAHWMLSESQGEAYRPYFGEPGYNMSDWKKRPTHKSLGASAMDQNRMPKLIYNVWKNALWMPYSLRPGVALQSHWNYSPGNQTVYAYSNCPTVELFVNNTSKGVRTPDPMTAMCEWTNVAWESGTLRAEGKDAGGTKVCFEERKTAEAPHHIVLTMEPALVKPDGSAFQILANGSDAGFVLATIVDAQGNWCPLASHNITFSTSGPGTYVGSSNFLNDTTQDVTFHAPGSRELMAEGGQMKVAVRSTFTSGTVTVSASAPGLVSGTTFFQTHPVPADPTTAIAPHTGAYNAKTFPQSRTVKLVGNSIVVPKEFAGKPVAAAVYDLSGKLLTTMAFRAVKARHGQKLPKNGVYIVRYKVLSAATE